MSSLKNKHTGLLRLAVYLGFVIVQLDISVVNVGIDALRHAFGAGITDIEWVINAYSLAFAACLLTSGAFADKFGARNVFVTGVTLFVAASIGCAVAPNMLSLIVLRAVQGVGAALLVPTSLTILRHAYTETKERNSAIGLWAACGSIALASGPLIGGVLITNFGWQSIFLVNLPIGALAVKLAFSHIPPDQPFAKKLDIPGQILIAIALGLITYGLTESGRYGWNSEITVGAIIAGIVFLCLFLYWQTKAVDPILPPSILLNPVLSGTTIIAFLSTWVFYGAVFTFSLYFQIVLKYSPFEAGLAFLPMMVFVVLSTSLSGQLTSRLFIAYSVVVGMSVTALGAILLYPVSADWGLAHIALPMILIGSGTSLVVPSLAGVMFLSVPVEKASIASGLFSSARQVGGVVGVAVFGALISHQGESSFTVAMHHIAIMAVMVMLASMLTGLLSLSRARIAALHDKPAS